MRRRLISRLTYANVVATLALFFALSTGVVYAANEWTGANIVDGSLTYLDIAPGSIGSGRIADESLTAVDLAPDSVASSEIDDDGVTADDLAPNSVGFIQIESDAVGASEIRDNAIDGSEVKDDSLTHADLAPNSVWSSEIGDGEVRSADIRPGAVTHMHIGANAVDSARIANGTVTVADLKGGEINGTISLGEGAVHENACRIFDITVPGAKTGDVAVFSLRGPGIVGLIFQAVRVKSANVVEAAVCNLTTIDSPAIQSLPVRVVTFG
jgi:hypothetical protein